MRTGWLGPAWRGGMREKIKGGEKGHLAGKGDGTLGASWTGSLDL